MTTMKAGVVHAKDDIRYEEIEKPTPKAGEVLVKVKYTGICGSDVPRVLGTACHYFPNVLGHEFSGTVAEVGEGVTSVKPGDRVAGVPLVPCMECDDCKRGDFSLCKHYSFVGSRQFGSFAEYVCVPELNTVKFADEVTFEQAALFEPTTIALHGIERLDFKGGHTVAVLGGGTIGILTAMWAKAFGAREVTVFDIVPERLEFAKKMGATAGVNTLDKDYREQALALTDGRGYDYLFETAGATPTMKMAFGLAANKAQICFIGTPKKEISFTVDEWECINRKEFAMTGSWMSYSAPFPGHEWSLTAEAYATGMIKFDEGLVFKKFPLSKIDEAFDMYRTPGAVKGKILIDSEA